MDNEAILVSVSVFQHEATRLWGVIAYKEGKELLRSPATLATEDEARKAASRFLDILQEKLSTNEDVVTIRMLGRTEGPPQ